MVEMAELEETAKSPFPDYGQPKNTNTQVVGRPSNSQLVQNTTELTTIEVQCSLKH